MLKHMLFVGAAALSFPALAQEQPATDPTAPPAAEQPAPTSPTAPAGDTSAAQPAPSGGTAATPAQIAQIVDQEFPTYDGDANGELNETEFSAWMKKLRAATDPSVDTESEAVKAWIAQSFAAADTDKSGGVNKSELTGFLSHGA